MLMAPSPPPLPPPHAPPGPVTQQPSLGGVELSSLLFARNDFEANQFYGVEGGGAAQSGRPSLLRRPGSTGTPGNESQSAPADKLLCSDLMRMICGGLGGGQCQEI